MDGVATQQVVRLFAIFFFIIKPCKRISESILLERSWKVGEESGSEGISRKKSKFWGACH